jgi:hypothetical protein
MQSRRDQMGGNHGQSSISRFHTSEADAKSSEKTRLHGFATARSKPLEQLESGKLDDSSLL